MARREGHHHALGEAAGPICPEPNVATRGHVSRGRLIVHGHFYQPSRVDPFSGAMPADPSAAPIVWVGSWRTLDPTWVLAPHWENFGEVIVTGTRIANPNLESANPITVITGDQVFELCIGFADKVREAGGQVHGGPNVSTIGS